MRLSHSPAGPTADPADVNDGVGSATRQRRSSATATATTALGAPRVTERPYRTTARGGTTTPDTREQQGTGAKAGTSSPVESLAAMRHADARMPASSAGTTPTSSSTATAASPPAASVRGRSGSTTQHRVYQPSSLFGPHGAPLSLSSSLLMADTSTAPARRPVLSSVKDRGAPTPSARFLASAGTCEKEGDDKTESVAAAAAASTKPSRQLTRMSSDAAYSSDAVTSTRERVAVSLAARGSSRNATPRASMEHNASTLALFRSGSSNCSESTFASSARRSADAGNAPRTTAAAGAAPPTPGESSQLHTLSPYSAPPPPEHVEGELREDGEELMSGIELRTLTTAASHSLVMRLAKYSATASPADPTTQHSGSSDSNNNSNRGYGVTAMRRVSALTDGGTSGTAPGTRRDSRKHSGQSACDQNDDEGSATLPLTMSSLVSHAAVPSTVQAVLKNPEATKEELRSALRTACRQCALLQRRLAKVSGQLTDQDVEAGERDSATAAAARDVATHQRCSVMEGSASPVRRSPRTSTIALPHEDARTSFKQEGELSVRNPTAVTPPLTPTTATSTAEAGRRVREKVASVTTAADANTQRKTATPVAPLSTSALLRGGTRSGAGPPQTQQQPTAAAATVSCTADMAAVLRSRVADEIRRVEATRRQAGSTGPAVAAAAVRGGGQRAGLASSTARHRQSSAADATEAADIASNAAVLHKHKSGSSSGGGRTVHPLTTSAVAAVNVTVKVLDDGAMSRRTVREAVVKSRDAGPGNLVTSPPPLPTPSRISSHDGEGDADDSANTPGEQIPCRHRSGSVDSTKSTAERLNFRRHASNTSDTVSVRSGNTFTLPSLPAACVDSGLRQSFLSRSHNSSGRLCPPPLPPSPSASESVIASGGSPAPQSAYHRRVRGASVASQETMSNGREGSICSGIEHPPQHVSAAVAGCTTPVPLISSRALTSSSTTLPLLKREEMTTGPLSARTLHQHSAEDVMEGIASRGVGRVNGTPRGDVAAQPSSWLSRTGGVSSPLHDLLPSIHATTATAAASPSPHSCSLLSRGPEAPTRAGDVVSGGGAAAAALSCVSSSLLEMVRQVAEEEVPVSPSFDDKKTELREWRRQAAKAGMNGAPSAC